MGDIPNTRASSKVEAWDLSEGEPKASVPASFVAFATCQISNVSSLPDYICLKKGKWKKNLGLKMEAKIVSSVNWIIFQTSVDYTYTAAWREWLL